MLEIPLTISVILLGAIIAQGIFASILLMIHRNNFIANRYLGLLLLSFSLWLLDDFFNAARIYQQNPDFYFLPIYFSLAFGPLIYFYTKSITQENFTFRKHHLWHFLPVLFQVALYLFLQSKDYSFRRWFWQEIHFPYTYNLEFIGSLFSLIVYLILSIRLVRKYQHWINSQFSEVSKINLDWLKLIQGILIVLCFLWLIDTGLRIFWAYYPQHDFSAIAMGLSILVLASGALLQSQVSPTGFNEQQKSLTAKEGMIDSVLLAKIKSAMQAGEYFLDPNLSLKSFAKAINESPRKVSHHINQGLQQPFIDFVNHYRVEAVKQHIKSNDLHHLTLTGIAYQCGFNSKSTFNRVFKKIAGLSPSAFQKRTQNR